jgi:hypothetical protein
VLVLTDYSQNKRVDSFDICHQVLLRLTIFIGVGGICIKNQVVCLTLELTDEVSYSGYRRFGATLPAPL